MSTISEKLTQLNTIKGDIKTAINNKGGEVGNDFSTYATAINNLSTGSGETYENPEFYELRTQKGTNYDNLFNSYNGPDIDVSQWDTSKVTSAKYCFSSCAKSMDISNWNLSSLTNTESMFGHFTNNNKYIDLSVLDFSNVTYANYMFQYSNTDYLDVRNINLTGTISYMYLFYECNGTELDLSNWDISKANNFNSMFNNSKYKKIDLTGWKTTNVKNFGYMFYGYSNGLEILIIPDWDMTNATNTDYFFYNSSSNKLKYIDLSRSNDLTIKKIASSLRTKTATTYGEVVIPSNTSQDAIDALTAKYWKPIGPKIDLNSTEVVLELDEIKPGKTTKICNGNSDPWYGDDRPETIEFISSDESIATVNGREITGVAEGTVTIECRRREDNLLLGSTTLTVSETDSKPNLVKFRIDESSLSNYYSAITVNGTGVTPPNLTKDPVTGIYSYDPGTQITSIEFGYTSNYNGLSELIKFNFNESNITNATSLLSNYRGSTIDLSEWDTSKVTRMDYFFSSCTWLTDIIGEIDMSNVGFTETANMFYCCYELKTLYLKNIFKNVTPYSSGNLNLEYTKVKDECLIYIINELPDLYAKGITSTSGFTFTLPKNNTLTEDQITVAVNKGWTCINVNY